MSKLRFRWSWDTRLFVIIPTITIEDFSVECRKVHVVFRFGPLAFTMMQDKSVYEAKEMFRRRMKDLDE
jgi:hypothetical protein